MKTEGIHSSIKRRLAWLESPLNEGTRVSTVCRRLCKKQNVDFMLGDSDVVLEIPDDDTLKQLVGMDEEAIEHPHKLKEEPDDTITPGEGAIGKDPEVEFQTTFDFASPLTKDTVIVGSSSSPLTTLEFIS